MSAASRDKKTLAYQLGEALSQMTDHYLLMTATPHKGDPENFCLFLELLDRDVYGDVKSLEEAMQERGSIVPSLSGLADSGDRKRRCRFHQCLGEYICSSRFLKRARRS